MIDIRITNNETTLILRGDTSIQLDPLVTKANYIGKTVAFERDGKVYEVGSFKRKNKRIVWLGALRITPLFVFKMFAMKLKNIFS